ncbi:MAG TPA: hypothetical protein VJR47_19620 [Stellaceae bacterium]|nr:hypothetical protein [Stellaceae bacterium]
MRKHNLAALALAFLVIVAAQGAAPLHAAEPWPPEAPSSPLALARHFRSLTAGGPFDPAQAWSTELGTFWLGQVSAPPQPTISFGQDLW